MWRCAMGEALTILVGGAVLLLVGYAGYLVGKNAGERRAYATVADLRQRLSAARLEREALVERERRLTERLRAANLPIRTPEWLR